MKKLLVLLLASVLVLGTWPNGTGQATEPVKIVAGTELIADIVRDLLPGQADLLPLVPASSCPGHHDLRASDLAFFARANMVIIHSWQMKAPGIPEAVEAANLPPERVQVATDRGSWLVPENQIAASAEVAAFLSALDTVDKKDLGARLEERVQRIQHLSQTSREKLAPFAGTPALSAVMQAEFVRWAGVDVIGEYGRAEDMSPGMLMELADIGKARKVQVVVDNLQSGAEAGVPLARELHAAHVGFSNFPLFSPEVPTYETLLEHNVALLVTALKEKAASNGQ